MKLIIARHGETASNELDLLQGQLDISLNDRGIAQAKALARALAREKIDIIYSSDLNRGRETAEIIASHLGKEVIAVREARERCFGIFEGTNRTAFYGRERALADPYSHRPEKGESFEDLFARARAFLAMLAQQHAGQTVLLVSHGDYARMCLGVLTGKTVREACQIPQKNSCINILEVEKDLSATVLSLNMTDHLPPELQSNNKSEL